MPLIQARDLSLGAGTTLLVQGISFSLEQGETLLVTGDSGVGKSTLLKTLFRLVQPLSGDISFQDRPLDTMEIHELRQHICYIPQALDGGPMVTREFIEEVVHFKHNSEQASEDRQAELMDYLDLDRSLLDQPMNQLSGGELQRITLMTGLLLNRKLYLLDEVTSGLDRDMKKKVVSLVNQDDRTAMVVSHDPQWRNKNVKELKLTKVLP